MATIKHKRGTSKPSTSDVAVGELAINTTDGSLYTQSNSSKIIQINSAVINVKNYGATGDGSTDDTAAIQSALNAGSVFFPAGTYIITSTISLTDKIRSINGVGQESVLKFVPSSAPDNLFEINRTSAEAAFFQVSNLRFDTTVADAGYAIKIEEIRITTGTTGHVVGGVDFLHITDVIFDADGSGYWRGALHQKNAGGTYWVNSTFRNNNSATAQQNSDTVGIWLQNTSPGGASNVNYKMIRCLHMSNFYIQRVYRAIYLNTTTASYGIESVYIDLGEIIARHGLVMIGAGHLDAISVQNVHMDVNVDAVTSAANVDVNCIRLIGSDLRKGNNGGDYTAGNLVNLGSGEILSIVGCQFHGNTNVAGYPDQNGIVLSGDYRRFNIDGGNFFRDLQTPILIQNTVNTGNVGPFVSDCIVSNDVNNSSTGSNITISTTSVSNGSLGYDTTAKVTATASGADVTGNLDVSGGVFIGTENHFLYRDSATRVNFRVGDSSGSHTYGSFANRSGVFAVGCPSGDLILEVGNEPTPEQAIKCINNAAVELYHNNTKQVETYASGLSFADNKCTKFGTDGDLIIYHDGSNSYISEIATGSLILRSNEIKLQSTTGEEMAKFQGNGQVDIYHDNRKVLHTNTDGITCLGGGHFHVNNDTSGGNCAIEMGSATAGNHYSYIDMVTDGTYTDYGTRILRTNAGANANATIVNRGTGNMDHSAPDGGTFSYASNSDYRLKENVVYMDNGITKLKTLKPCRFNFKHTPDKIVDGFIAHEASTAVPSAVKGTKDEVMLENGPLPGDLKKGDPIYQSIDYGRIVPLLTAALQEAIAKIEVLETEVATLKG